MKYFVFSQRKYVTPVKTNQELERRKKGKSLLTCFVNFLLTIFTFTLLDLVFISDGFMTGLAVKPCSKIYIRSLKNRGNVKLNVKYLTDLK